MIPHFRENDYFGGTEAACVTLMKLASGEISAEDEPEDEGVDDTGASQFILSLQKHPKCSGEVRRKEYMA